MELETIELADWSSDEKCCVLLGYELSKKLRSFVFSIDIFLKQIKIAVIETQSSQNEDLLKELIFQKYPRFSIKFCLAYPKGFHIALTNLKIQEQIYHISSRIDIDNDIAALYRFILEIAIDERASDLHLESNGSGASFKIRQDDRLREIAKFTPSIFEALRNKIKLEAKLDISEKRLPQDGRYTLGYKGKEYDFRISCVPIYHGESIVIRILYKQNDWINLEGLKFTSSNIESIKKVIQSPYGIILITGPTGSGKSTTLYALLEEIKSIEKKLITIEDPIEYQINLATQIQIDPDYGFGFAQALRAILRQDPDVIMVGEIRDQETLKLALQASLTGHLVLATLHTNDCASTITRLLDMDAPPYLISQSLLAVISQRLIRRLCPNCKKLDTSYPSEGFFTFSGCEACNMRGFMGREAIAEILEITPMIKSLILENPAKISDYLKSQGFKTLFDDGLIKVKNALTSYDEIYRVAKK